MFSSFCQSSPISFAYVMPSTAYAIIKMGIESSSTAELFPSQVPRRISDITVASSISRLGRLGIALAIMSFGFGTSESALNLGYPRIVSSKSSHIGVPPVVG